MSDISITRFQPAPATRDKVNAVDPSENESSGLGSGGSGNHGEKQDQRALKESPPEDNNRDAAGAADGKALEQAVARLNDYVQNVQRDIVFDLDEEGTEPSVTVLDRSSRQVLRHFARKEALELAKKLDAQDPLNLFDASV